MNKIIYYLLLLFIIKNKIRILGSTNEMQASDLSKKRINSIDRTSL